MEKTELHIDGMHCGSCAVGIQMLVSGMDGVSSAQVSYEDKKGVFEYDPAKTNKDAILKAMADLGYKGS
jgi:copper chaperone CopZ